MRFERTDLVADRSWSYAEFFGRALEAAMARSGFESTKRG
jgi:hypothetical protein